MAAFSFKETILVWKCRSFQLFVSNGRLFHEIFFVYGRIILLDLDNIIPVLFIKRFCLEVHGCKERFFAPLFFGGLFRFQKELLHQPFSLFLVLRPKKIDFQPLSDDRAHDAADEFVFVVNERNDEIRLFSDFKVASIVCLQFFADV